MENKSCLHRMKPASVITSCSDDPLGMKAQYFDMKGDLHSEGKKES